MRRRTIADFRFWILDCGSGGPNGACAAVLRLTVLGSIVLLSVALPGYAQAQSAAEASLPTVTQTITLNQAVDIAIKNNPSPSQQTAQANAAKARVGIAKSATRPRLSTTTYATAGNLPHTVSSSPGVLPRNSTRVPDTGQLDQNFMALYPLYTGGKLKNQVRNARERFNAATSGVRTSQLDVSLDAKIAYRRVQLAQEFVRVYQRRVDESRERLRIAELAYKEGRIAKYDLLRNQTDLAESEQQLNNSKRDVETAMVELKSVLGIAPDSNLTLAEMLTCVPPDQNEAEIRSLALKQRPEIASAQAQVRAAQAAVAVAKGAYKPQVYAVGMQDFLGADGDGFDQGFTVGVTASLPIFDGGERKSAVSEAEATVDSARAAAKDVVLLINREVGTAWAEQGAAAKNVDLAKAAVTQAEEDYRVIQLRYQAGKAINVEVLDALASLTRAETDYAQALYEYDTAQDRLNRAMGNV